jgi:hypothetical protein
MRIPFVHARTVLPQATSRPVAPAVQTTPPAIAPLPSPGPRHVRLGANAMMAVPLASTMAQSEAAQVAAAGGMWAPVAVGLGAAWIAIYYQNAKDGRELGEAVFGSAIAGGLLERAGELALRGEMESAAVVGLGGMGFFLVGAFRIMITDHANSFHALGRELHATRRIRRQRAIIRMGHSTTVARKFATDRAISNYMRAVGQLEHTLQNSPLLLKMLGFDPEAFRLRDEIGDIRVFEGVPLRELREHCDFEHPTRSIFMPWHASTAHIARALMKAVMLRGLERTVTFEDVMAVRLQLLELTPESLGTEAIRIQQAAEALAGKSAEPLSQEWQQLGASWVFEYGLRTRPAQVEALITRVISSVGTGPSRIGRGMLNRLLLPVFGVMTWPMVHAANFINENMSWVQKRTTSILQRNLLISGLRGRWSRRLQREVGMQDVRETFGIEQGKSKS